MKPFFLILFAFFITMNSSCATMGVLEGASKQVSYKVEENYRINKIYTKDNCQAPISTNCFHYYFDRQIPNNNKGPELFRLSEKSDTRKFETFFNGESSNITVEQIVIEETGQPGKRDLGINFSSDNPKTIALLCGKEKYNTGVHKWVERNSCVNRGSHSKSKQSYAYSPSNYVLDYSSFDYLQKKNAPYNTITLKNEIDIKYIEVDSKTPASYKLSYVFLPVAFAMDIVLMPLNLFYLFLTSN